MVVALDKKIIESSTTARKIPALDPQWKQHVTLLRYVAPPLNTSDAAAVEEWSEQLSFIEEDLVWLLSLPHDKFWCQVIFEESVVQCIDSYLRYAPRSYDIVASLPGDVQQKNRSLHRLVFLVCVRMATHKESKECFITPAVFGDIIYENFIFDVPKLMDLCVLYGASNGPLLKKMIDNIFKNQPHYNDDLQTVVPTILQVFKSIEKKCADDTSTGSPQRLNETRRKKVLEEMPVAEFQDIIFYLLDTSITLRQFLAVYVPACRVFSQCNFHFKLAQFYESIVTSVSEALKNRDWDNPEVEMLLRGKLHVAQVNLLETFHQIMDVTCLQPLLEKSDTSHAEKHIEEYMDILTSCIGEKRFLGHMDSLHPFQEDWDLIQQTQYAVDETRLQFLQDGVQEAAMSHGKLSKKKQMKKERFSGLAPQAGASASVALPEDYQNGEDLELDGACASAPAVSDIELASLTSNVKDLLPELGDGFVEVCLGEFNYDVERLINALLEDHLPPHLQELDRTMPRSKKTSKNFVDPMDAAKEESLLSRRKNVFDNDEFDVFNSKDVDVSKIHMGKKDNLPSNKKAVKDFLDDKSDVQAVRGRYDPYGVLIDIVEDDGMNNNEYDDEYDDTYDDNEIGADDAGSADELTTRRPFTVPRILGGDISRRANRVSSSEDSEEEGPPRDRFVEDPAAIRERQAQRYASRQHHQNRGPPAQQQPQKKHDVKGAPKGQGQSSDVLRNRAFKEKNKSSRVNHNRRVLADKKRRVP